LPTPEWDSIDRLTLDRPLVDDMNHDRNTAGIDSVDEHPPWTATGSREIRARQVHKRHLKILDDLQTELDVGRREAIAALCEYYNGNPTEVLRAVRDPEFR